MHNNRRSQANHFFTGFFSIFESGGITKHFRLGDHRGSLGNILHNNVSITIFNFTMANYAAQDFLSLLKTKVTVSLGASH